MHVCLKSIKVWRLIAILLAVLLSACTDHSNQVHFETKQGQATLGPLTQTKYLLFSDQSQADVYYEVEGERKLTKAVDILILFDRTSSMKREIDETANAAREIVNDIQSAAPNTRFAVAAVSDYSPMFTPATDKRTWLLQADFTKSANVIANATKSITLSNGGDNPEAYSRGLYEASLMQWRPEAKKIILFFGDAIAHKVDPGRDEIMGTDDDLTMPMVLQQLAKKEIEIVGVYTSDKTIVKRFFNQISTKTGGNAVSLADANDSGNTIVASIKAALHQKVSLQAGGENQHWIKIQQFNQGLRSTQFEIVVKPADETPAGVYDIPLRFTLAKQGAAATEPVMTKNLMLKVVTGWYNHPLLPWLPLLLLIGILLWHTWRMLGGGYTRVYRVTSRRNYATGGYSVSHLLLDLLVLASIIGVGVSCYLSWQGLVLSELLSWI